jgi:ABC-type amino acid transport substrate-binding protein
MPHWALPVPALRVLASCVLLTGIGAAGQARGQADAAATSTRPLLRVITGYAAPFVMLPGTPVSGFSIEIWQEVARRLGVDTAWTGLPDLRDKAQIDAAAECRHCSSPPDYLVGSGAAAVRLSPLHQAQR